MKVVKIGTRRSDLAMCQARLMVSHLRKKHPKTSFLLVPLVTTGDFRRDTLRLSVEDKKQWVIDIEQQLLSKEIDLAIHSAKDVPLDIELGTEVLAVLERENPFDVLIYKQNANTPGVPLSELAPGSVVGTSSKRRRSQLLKLRPDLCVLPYRGNITTRISKLQESTEFDAILLAFAGLSRIKLHKELNLRILTESEMIPAIGQGQLLAQFRQDDSAIRDLVSGISLFKEQSCNLAERSCIDKLGADCHSSVGVYASVLDDTISISLRILSIDGTEVLEDHISGDVLRAAELGTELGERAFNNGGAALL